ncbi:putative Fe-S oxidoreductase N-terminal region [Flavobacterium psychrophilum]|uniref:(Fe-S)-binding protein n=1 Tax=Flavobacterium psychrophilum TaxID=96345 RepID=UPI00073F927A|nr:(Fe-S)-binding protein [Flavobacterium psychrophilum]SNB22512.1 putative Fe-S oxidoreductase N-terminal region [Flavobacterium psychrophilum]SNB97156.1 putative Fe-S oxidoreductase N-terminal region [Flavobacterium psychrophilum]GEJ32436.1 Fe-S oxidoreductase [Flavobacterium psychrophilum]GEJ35720.1 Fe-S oxidoreductase [Flavobacterium psychrophilum]GEJ39893.1 Fe-S oxidoreductase [Flavobacterium psychrophilum]
MSYLDNILFFIILCIGIGYFAINVKKIIRNIKLGQEINRSDNPSARWKNMAMIALGQSKMVKRPVAGILHIFVYVGFVVINLEVLEIIIDGLFGTHRIFSFLGTLYNLLIGSFEILALLVLVAVIAFWIRRNIIKLKRFIHSDLKGWPKSDANYILYFEIVLMSLFLLMNAADYHLQLLNVGEYHKVGSFPISQFLEPIFNGMSESLVIMIERGAWWIHICGILVFLNYLYFSKHLHILLAFPNTYFANLKPQGQFDNLESVTKEVKLMMDPNADPFAAPAPESNAVVSKFGAQDVQDLNWVQLLNAYTCTECGRCTSSCPANQTGKKLSPRKIMMDTRDRLVEVGNNIDANKGVFIPDSKFLLGDYITPEELWACTSCNACVEECPVNISPLSIIIDMRRYLVMEQSAAPQPLNAMMTNIENNSAPWQYNQQDRLNWKNE